MAPRLEKGFLSRGARTPKPRKESSMNAFRLINIATAGLALLVAGAAAAQDVPPAADPLQAREQARHTDSEARSAWREQQQERVRNMTPEERALMRDTSVDGRARMENRNGQGSQGGEGARERRRDGSGQGGGYGQGYQSRQGQGGSMGGGMGGGRGGRGR